MKTDEQVNGSVWRRTADRLWNSPSAATSFSVVARAAAFFVPVPFITATFSTEVVALWFVILTFQAFATSVIGVFPTILMHMVSYANAGAAKLHGHVAGEIPQPGDGQPNEHLLAQLSRGLLVVFLACGLIWVALAGTVGTLVIWRPLELSGLWVDGLWAWGIFVVTSACRLFMQAYATFLLGKGFVAEVRRLEGMSWTVGGVASAVSLIVMPDFVLAMLMLQAPFVINLLLLRRMAIARGWAPAPYGEMHELHLKDEVLPRAAKGGFGAFMSYLVIYGSALMFAQIGDGPDVAAFAFALNIFGIVGQLALAPMFGALPRLSALLARGELSQQNMLAQSVMLKGLLIYAGAVLLVPLGVYVANLVLPVPLLFVDMHLWALLAVANFLFRYGAMHLHFYTTTNDIRWHIVDGTNTVLFLGLLYAGGFALPALGLESTAIIYVFPLCQMLALMLFYVPYARRLTLVHFNYGFDRDVAYAAAPAGLGIAALVMIELARVVQA